MKNLLGFSESDDIYATDRLTPPASTYTNVPGLMNDVIGDSEMPDPFDTSHVYKPPSFRYYSHVMENDANSTKYCNLENDTTSGSSPIVLPTSIENNYRDILSNNGSSPMKKLNSNFIAELEKNIAFKEENVNSSFPALKPPPQSVKSSKKQSNFMPSPGTKSNPRVNTWSAKSTNLQAEQQRPMSVCLPNSVSLRNLGDSLPSALSVEDLNSAIENTGAGNEDQRYSNDVRDTERMFNEMWITEQQSAHADKQNNSNNIYKDPSSKCVKIPFNKELVSMLTKSSNRNIYDNSTNYSNDTFASASNRYGNSESMNQYRYDLEHSSGDTYNRYDSAASVYERNIYGNAANIYDAVPEEDGFQDTRSKNIYDSVADECNYYNFISEQHLPQNSRSDVPSNSVSILS